MGLDRVELRPAFVWNCPECGREYFQAAIVREMAEEDRQALLEAQGIPPETEGDFLGMPDYVSCKHCDRWFPVERPASAEEDSD